MKDNNKAIIGQTVNDDDHPIGYSMDDGNSYSFESKLPQPLVITGEHESDYVQFTYGSLSWQSKAANGGGSCTVGGWDPRDGPVCGLRSGNTNAVCEPPVSSCSYMLILKYLGEQYGLQLPMLKVGDECHLLRGRKICNFEPRRSRL